MDICMPLSQALLSHKEGNVFSNYFRGVDSTAHMASSLQDRVDGEREGKGKLQPCDHHLIEVH